ncbi:MAG: hypothetical protein V4505_14200 [Pseudomonadota bacterium]
MDTPHDSSTTPGTGCRVYALVAAAEAAAATALFMGVALWAEPPDRLAALLAGLGAFVGEGGRMGAALCAALPVLAAWATYGMARWFGEPPRRETLS